MKTCIICQGRFVSRRLGGPEEAGNKICSAVCRKERHRQRQRHSNPKRVNYYRAYYAANRSALLARHKEYHLRNRDRILAKQRLAAAVRRAQRLSFDDNLLARKVAKEWQVSIVEARVMVAAGQFPP